MKEIAVVIMCLFSISLSKALINEELAYGNLMKILSMRYKQETAKVSIVRSQFPVFETIGDIDKRKLIKQADRYFSRDNFDLLTASQTFDVSVKCLNHTKLFISAIVDRENWAVKMFDAMGKIPSDILAGNLAWYGSYDECVEIKASMTVNDTGRITQKAAFEGKYCQAGIPIPNPEPSMANPSAFALLEIGMCFPDSCSESDALALTNTVLSFISFHNTTLTATSASCQENNLPYDTKAKVVLVICGIYIVLLVLATIYDIFVIQLPKQRLQKREKKVNSNNENTSVSNEASNQHQDEYKQLPDDSSTKPSRPEKRGIFEELMESFSIYSNGRKLLSTYQAPGSLRAVHGIRFFSTTWVILCHTFVFYIRFGTSANLGSYLPDLANRWTFMAIVNGFVSVDSFFTLSGLLMAYLVLKEMKKNGGKLNWPMFYFHRFWRLTPPYMLTLMVYATLRQYFSDGPVWPQTEIENCAEYWWTNLLYINNIVKPEQCFAWAWYLANDMQFFVVSPLLFVPLFYSEIIGIVVCLVVLLGLTITTGIVSSVNRLPPSPYGGAIDADFDAYNDAYYITPHTRMAPYVVGILAGYILYKTQCRRKLNRVINLFGWVVAAGLACVVLYGLYDPLNHRHMLSIDVSALYNAIHKPIWAACLCWVIYACVTGNGGFVNTFLSWGGFVPLSRLTYCAYLVHVVVIVTFMLSTRHAVFLTDMHMVWTFIGHLVATYGVAFIVSLAFEAPMMGLEKVIFRKGKHSATEGKEKQIK